MPNAILLGELLVLVALVHVDLVHAVPRQEAEDLVLDLRLRTPTLAERVQERILVAHCALHVLIELLVQVVVGAGRGQRQGHEILRREQVAADEVEREPIRFALDDVVAARQLRELLEQRMLEVRFDDVLDLRAIFGLHVDGDAEVRRVVDDVDLIMRVAARGQPAVDRRAFENTV